MSTFDELYLQPTDSTPVFPTILQCLAKGKLGIEIIINRHLVGMAGYLFLGENLPDLLQDAYQAGGFVSLSIICQDLLGNLTGVGDFVLVLTKVLHREYRRWRAVGQDRILNTWYQNTTSETIIVRCSCQRSTDNTFAFLIGVVEAYNEQGGRFDFEIEGAGQVLPAGYTEQCLVEFMVPPGRGYKVRTFGGGWEPTIRQWLEYR